MTSCDKVRFAFLGDLELQGERLRPKATDIRRDFDQVIKHERLVEIEMDLDTWKPDVQTVEHLCIRESNGAEELCLGYFAKAEELPVITNGVSRLQTKQQYWYFTD